MLLTVKEANDIRDLLQKEMYSNHSWTRFNYCQAWTTFSWHNVTSVCNGKDVLALPVKSYNTIVAFMLSTVDSNGNELLEFYEVGKYSRTTSKQVTQIYNSRYSDKAERIYVDRV